MQKIPVENAVGQVLCHDITRIIKDVEKGVAFPKGHVIRFEDIHELHSMGKFHVYVWEKNEGELHENEAAEILQRICLNTGMKASAVKEGKIELFAETDGLFRVSVKELTQINSIDGICIATRHNNSPVKKGDKLAGCRVVPLVIPKEKMDRAEEIAQGRPVLELLPYKPFQAGILTTGREVEKGLIKDTFTPVVEAKLLEYGVRVFSKEIVGDDKGRITEAILRHKKQGANFILCTGGMSVDPDDATGGAISASGARVVSYGAPVLPGSMFMLAYFEDGTPVLGLPGCVMYERRTIFDIVLPRIVAGVHVSKRDFAEMGAGGFCLQCKGCYFPACSFGKGCS